MFTDRDNRPAGLRHIHPPAASAVRVQTSFQVDYYFIGFTAPPRHEPRSVFRELVARVFRTSERVTFARAVSRRPIGSRRRVENAREKTRVTDSRRASFAHDLRPGMAVWGGEVGRAGERDGRDGRDGLAFRGDRQQGVAGGRGIAGSPRCSPSARGSAARYFRRIGARCNPGPPFDL